MSTSAKQACTDMVLALLGVEKQGVGHQIASNVRRFESHPISVATITQTLKYMKHKGKYKKRLCSFDVAEPIPDMPPCDKPRGNIYCIELWFCWDRRGQFKIQFKKYTATLKPEYAYTYSSFSKTYEKVYDRNENQVFTERFCYTLRDAIGVLYAKVKGMPVCGTVVDIKNKAYKILCGNTVHISGAKCERCLGRSLKRKYEEMG